MAVLREDGQRIEADRVAAPGGLATPPRASVQPPAGDELAAAEREFQAAYEDYTRLITTGGAGSVDQALARYRAAHERLKQLKSAKPTQR